MNRIFSHRQGSKTAILGFTLLLYLSAFLPLPALAQSNTAIVPQGENSIRTLLCAPRTDNQASGQNDLVDCINHLYRFVIAVAATASVLLLAWAGYLYMFGGEE